MNKNTESAIAKINESRSEEVQSQAREIVGHILCEQEANAQSQVNIEAHRDEIKAMESIEVTAQALLGSALPATPNANQKAIAKAISELVEEREEPIRALINEIDSELSAIKARNVRIAEQRKKLEALAAGVVNASDVAGS